MNKEWSLKDQTYSDFLNLCDEETIIDVVKNHGFSILYIKQPSEKVQVAAVNQNFYAFEYIKNPSEKAQLFAINNYNDEFFLICRCLNKITDPILLNVLYLKVKLSKSKQKIKLSPYWKDDANLILEVING